MTEHPSQAPPADPGQLLAVGLAAATAAGEVPLSQQCSAGHTAHAKTTRFDLVTAADIAAEEIIRSEIARRRPADVVLGEEGGLQGSGSVQWLVNPLDGTVNYVNRLPAWAVSVAEIDGSVAAAVVHAPALGRTYTGQRNASSWCNGERLSGPRARQLGDAVVATGFAASAEERSQSRQLDHLRCLLPHVRDVRCHGAASLELCSVADGELDAYVESALQVWDVAAGALIAREAGVEVTGEPGTEHPLVAADAALIEALTRLIEQPRRLMEDGGSRRG